MSKIPTQPVTVFRTANSIDEAMVEIKAMLYPYDDNTVHSLVMLYHNTLLKQLSEERSKCIELPSGYSMNSESDRYLSIEEIKRLLQDHGFTVTVCDTNS